MTQKPYKEAIAIIGMGCRFPESPNLAAFEGLLANGIDAITEVPSSRWSVAEFYHPQPQTPGKMNTRWGGFLDQIECFDAKFFKISPKEAARIDPQQRLVLEVSWESLEDAGIAADSLAGSQTGVFLGIGNFDYGRLLCRDWEQINPYHGTGLTLSVAANRLSYFLDLHGPSMAIETACSSSLVAIHLACQSLLQGESDLALAGGVSLMILPDMTITFSQARMMSGDGRCKTFDAQADGYVRGEGCGVIVLKRLSDAINNGDRILAQIRGSAVNHDGLSNGLTAPNGIAQRNVICQALKNAGVAPQEISYIEAHGTGTPLGDPVEIRAIKAALSEGRNPENRCAIGSVKTNIGHLENAAGIAGVIKVVLSLQKKRLFPHLHLNQLNPYLEIEGTPFFIPQENQPWQQERRLAGVSGFSFGGTNCHLILEEAHKRPISTHSLERPIHCLTLSAKTPTALEALAQSYQTFLANPQISLADVCFTANTGRSHFSHRLALVAENTQQMGQLLQAFGEGKEASGIVTGNFSRRQPPKIAFLFTGQGSQYLGMGYQLYQTQPTFRQILTHCDEILRPQLGKSLIEILYSPTSEVGLLNQTLYTQPALFALEYALAQLWQAWGIEPTAVIGHSLGEYVAACVAGVLTLEEGLTLIAQRGKLIQSLPQEGKMVAVFADEETVNAALTHVATSLVSIATLNSVENTVISGQSEEIQRLVELLEKEGIRTQPLSVSHAFHSPLIEPMLDEWEQTLGQIKFSQAKIPLVSNLTGTFFRDGEIPNAHYWRSQTRNPVRFKDGLEALLAKGYELFVEIGPKPILSKLGQRSGKGIWLPSLTEGKADWQILTSSLAVLYTQGIKINGQGWDKNYSRNRLSLPTYPFQRQRYWIEQKEPETDIREEPFLPMLSKPFETEPSLENKEEHLTLMVSNPSETQQQQIIRELSVFIGNLLQIPVAEIDCRTSLLEMGADSLVLLDAVQGIENTYGLKIHLNQLFEALPTIEALGRHIAEHLPALPRLEPVLPAKTASDLEPAPNSSLSSESPLIAPLQENGSEVSASVLERQIMLAQLQVMSEQLQILQRKPLTSPSPSSPSLPLPPPPLSSPIQELTSQQQSHLEALISRYSQRTPKSKQRAQSSRSVLADSRAIAGFRPSIKEILYPIVGESAQGSRFWDIDGNEYLDMAMGFGVLLLGHNPPVITQALQTQLQQGLQIGPQSNLAFCVAHLIQELTGVERVTFCNSGTEAVMTALRLARTVTGKNKIAVFAGSYHGHFDGVLGIAPQGTLTAVPMAAGISKNAVKDLLVLDYDNPQSLEILSHHADELAAVLVEPVPSRRPNLQPKAFLHQLKTFTQSVGIPLIFDDVLVGFRIHPGGSQAWFGIEADLVTYGKIIGGGLPIGVVAGKATYLNAIDGGFWNYEDNSYPMAEKTFFAGTFNKNHLGMAAAHAMLQHLKEQGETLQQQLNERTARLATILNNYFEAEQLPLELVYFGSLFRFASTANIDLLYYHLLEKGIYIWEGRNCFLSTAHTEADIEFFVQAIQESIRELRNGGFFSPNPKKSVAQVQPTLTQNQSNLLTPKAIYEHLAPQIQTLISQPELQQYPTAFAQLEKLSLAYIFRAFEQLGWKFTINEQFSITSIAEKLGIVSQHKLLLNRLLEILAQENILVPIEPQRKQKEKHWQVVNIPVLNEPQQLAQAILARYPFLKAELALLTRCAQALAEVLQEKRHPLQLLFPQGDLTTSTQLYQESPIARFMNTLIGQAISLALSPSFYGTQKQNSMAENKVRILEIGAGTGGTTAYILPHLLNQNAEYYFTDLSPLFISKAKQKFQDSPFVHYDILDIEQDPTTQNLGKLQYQIIVAANVLHSTANLRQSLEHIRQLLSPGGIFILMEGTSEQRWLDLIFGLTEGWWKFSDWELRPNYPLISSNQWQNLLYEIGFQEAFVLPDNSSLSALQSVIIARSPRQIPLTQAQKQLWVLSQLEQEGSIAYNESVRLEFKGQLKVEAMRQAMQNIINRHEALRIVINPSGETQEILPSWEIQIPYLDFSSTTEEKVKGWLSKTVNAPFNLSEKPLLRVEIVKLSANLHWLVLTIHHLISDGWSIDVILEELATFYNAQCQGISPQLTLPPQFSDYIYYQQSIHQIQPEEAYWLEQFSSSIPQLELPTDFPYPDIQTYRGNQQACVIKDATYVALQKLSNQQGCTLFMTLLASFNLLLWDLSNQDEMVIGIAAAGQLALGWKNLVGYCVNVLPLRLSLEGETFQEHLASLKKLLLKAYQHQNYPLARLLEKLKLKRDPSRPPLINVQFNLDKFGGELEFFELEVKAVANFSGATKRSLTWNFNETEGHLGLSCTYNQDLFKLETIQNWLEKFELILHFVAEEPEITLKNITQHLRDFDRDKQQEKEQKLQEIAVKKLTRIKRSF